MSAMTLWMGSLPAVLGSVVLILVWALTGPVFAFSSTWQLVINTTTTIVTFNMVFVIQNTQNRDSAALHTKLDALIKAMPGADDELAHLEDEDAKTIQMAHEKL